MERTGVLDPGGLEKVLREELMVWMSWAGEKRSTRPRKGERGTDAPSLLPAILLLQIRLESERPLAREVDGETVFGDEEAGEEGEGWEEGDEARLAAVVGKKKLAAPR
jgi:hypothetical protein